MNIKLDLTIREFKALRQAMIDEADKAKAGRQDWILLDNYHESNSTVDRLVKHYTDKQERYQTIVEKLNQAVEKMDRSEKRCTKSITTN